MTPFNIVIITQDDPFYVRLFFEEFLNGYKPLQDIRSVVIAPAMGKKSLKKLVMQMYNFYGPVDFIRVGVKYILYKMLDRLSSLLPVKGFYSISQVCRHHGIPVAHVGDINSPAFLSSMAAMDLDLLISIAAPQIFKEPLIRLPRNGCINIHNSKLPKYRGMMPNFWQMLNGEHSVGVTVHRINAGIDDGEILLQQETPILRGESLDALIRRTKKHGAHVMIEVLNAIKTDDLHPRPNPSSASTYYSFPSTHDVRAFKDKGLRLL